MGDHRECRASGLAPLVAVGIVALLASCAGSTKTREELAEEKSIGAERALLDANQAMDRLDADLAAEKLEQAKEALNTKVAAHHPDHSFQLRELESAEARLEQVRAEIERKRLEEAVAMQRAKVDELVARLETALEPLQAKETLEIDKARIDQAIQARGAVLDQLSDGLPLEKRAPAYEAYAKKVHVRMERVPKLFERAAKIVAFKEGPVTSSKKARALVQKSQLQSDLGEQITLLLEAKAELSRCSKWARRLSKETPALRRMRFFDGESGRTPKGFVKSCKRRARTVAKQVKRKKRKLRAKKKKRRRRRRRKRR